MNSRTFYRTRTGTRYHVGNCNVIIRVTTPINLSDVDESGLDPCRFCNPVGSTVYRTRTGRKYHEENCNVIRRVTTPINRSEVSRFGLDPCRFCNPG